MKSTFKIFCKLALIGVFLYFTPFYKGFVSSFSEAGGVLDRFVYKQKTMDQSIALKEQLNVLSYNSNLTLPKEEITVETTQEDPVVVPKKTEVMETGKKIYIYNTHQEESYKGGKTVMDAAAILAKKLEDKGIKVILETNDFPKYARENGLDYNKSYVVSHKYLNDALVNYNGFDLIIDLHRDSIPREVSYIESDGKTYAKAMMVVGGLGKNAKTTMQTSSTLTDIINKKKSGMMRSVMNREAYYNQEVHKNVVLIELGGDVNTFEEVTNTTDYLAEGIAELLESR